MRPVLAAQTRPRRRGRLAAALAAVGSLAAAAPALGADPIMPLADVRPGMTAEARTVVHGTDIVSFPVTILDVADLFTPAAAGVGFGPVILAKAGGPLMDQTGGVAEGMSGSPVYVSGADGVPRVIGAVAFGYGEEGSRTFGIQPIEAMLGSAAGARANGLVPRAVKRAAIVRDRAAARSLARRRPDLIPLVPLGGRISVAGVSRELLAPLRARFGNDINVTSVGSLTPKPPTTLVPGASLFEGFAGGGIRVGGLGTVTYVDGSTVIGFGHPGFFTGPSRFLLGDAWVYTVISAPVATTSYKLGELQNLQGMITSDRAAGVTGALGPVDAIAGTATAVHEGRGTSSTVHVTLAPDDRTAPLMASLLQDEPAVRAADGLARGTISVGLTVTSPDLPRPFRYFNRYAAESDVIAVASGALPRIVAIMQQNSAKALRISSIDVQERIVSQVRAARIVGASIVPRRVRPGGRAKLLLRIRPWRAADRTIRVKVRIPDEAPPGRTALRVVPNAQGGFDPAPANLAQQLGLTAGTGARAVRLASGVVATAPGSPVTRVLRGLARATDDRNDAVRLVVAGDDPSNRSIGTSAPAGWVLYGGSATARVTVR